MTDTSRCFLLLPCAGVGARAQAKSAAGADLPKQYQPILGRAVVQHTLDALQPLTEIAQTLVVLAPDDTHFAALCTPSAHVTVAYCGGATRAQTVANGLQHLRAHCGAEVGDWVLVHDAARCLIEPAWVRRLLQACQAADSGGLLAVPVADTLKAADSAQRVAETVERSNKWLAQTPQMFRLGELQTALAACHAVSDEASAMEQAGHAPLLLPGHTHNLKVTYPEDFALAQSILRLRAEQQT